jgi:hypothetical protein
MKYMLMIHEDEAVYDTPGAMEAVIGQHMAFSQNWQHRRGRRRAEADRDGHHRAHQGGSQTLHDGPFAETKEQFGGFYLVDVPDLDAALEIARRCRSPVTARSRCGR